MFKLDISRTRQLFAFSLADLIPEDSDVWLYVDLFDELDFEEFDWDYTAQGEEGHEPRLILRTVFYGLTHGIASGRKLADACLCDGRYVVLSGGNRPSYRTFARFVRRHEARLEAFFVQVVRLAQRMGLSSLGRVAIDGSRFKASTSKHKAMSYGRMEQAITAIKAELTKLKEELRKANSTETDDRLSDDIRIREKRLAKIKAAKAAIESEARGESVEGKTQKSFNDHDALPMAKKRGEFLYGYNCQAVVDADSQIVVAADVHDSVHDGGALPDMLAQVEANCGTSPAEVLADAGYRSYENLVACADRKTKAYIALGKGEADNGGRHPVQDLKYYSQQDRFRCLRGKAIRQTDRGGRNTYRAIQVGSKTCRGCPRKSSCSLYHRRNETIWVPAPEYGKAARLHLGRMRSDVGKTVYKARKVIVEPVFGNIKTKGILIRHIGRKKVRCWWRMAATAHNIEKIIKNRG